MVSIVYLEVFFHVRSWWAENFTESFKKNWPSFILDWADIPIVLRNTEILQGESRHQPWTYRPPFVLTHRYQPRTPDFFFFLSHQGPFIPEKLMKMWKLIVLKKVRTNPPLWRFFSDPQQKLMGLFWVENHPPSKCCGTILMKVMI